MVQTSYSLYAKVLKSRLHGRGRESWPAYTRGLSECCQMAPRLSGQTSQYIWWCSLLGIEGPSIEKKTCPFDPEASETGKNIKI